MFDRWDDSLHDEILGVLSTWLTDDHANRLATDIVSNVRREWAGEQIYVPKSDPAATAFRAEVVSLGRQQGKSMAMIAEQLGVSRSTCYRVLRSKCR